MTAVEKGTPPLFHPLRRYWTILSSLAFCSVYGG